MNSVTTRQEVRSIAYQHLSTRFPGSLIIHNSTAQDEEEETIFTSEFYQLRGMSVSLRRVHLYWDTEEQRWIVAYTDQNHQPHTHQREAVPC